MPVAADTIQVATAHDGDSSKKRDANASSTQTELQTHNRAASNTQCESCCLQHCTFLVMFVAKHCFCFVVVAAGVNKRHKPAPQFDCNAALFSDTQPLWHCRMACDETHKCLFSMCFLCHQALEGDNKENEGHGKGNRRGRGASKGHRDKRTCNHALEHLEALTDITCCKLSCLDKKTKEDNCPMKCCKCKKRIKVANCGPS